MKPKYRLSLYCIEENLPEASSQLRQSLKSSGILDRIDIFPLEIDFVDHGQNPVGDSDCRTYIKVISPEGKEIFQTSDVLLKTISRDFGDYAQRVINAVQQDLKIAV